MNVANLGRLEDFINSYDSDKGWTEKDRQLFKEICESIGAPAQIAQALGISVATLYRWQKREKGKAKGAQEEGQRRPPPSLQHLKRLRELVVTGFFNSTTAARPPKTLGGMADVLIRVRTLQEVQDQNQFCSKFWIMRSGRRFAIASDPKMFNSTLDFLEREPHAEIYFVFRDNGPDEKLDSLELNAKIAYCAFREHLDRDHVDSTIASRIKAVPLLSADEANAINLTDYWTSFAMAEYSEEGYSKCGRSVNVWSEFIFDVSQSPDVEDRRTVWLELPPLEALIWKDKRIAVLTQALNRELARNAAQVKS
jgi:hypothetical protein